MTETEADQLPADQLPRTEQPAPANEQWAINAAEWEAARDQAHEQQEDDDPVEVAERLPVRREVVTDETLGTLIPLREELSGLAAIAVTLAKANVVPDALRGQPENVLAIILTGRELGVAPMTAIRNFHVIKGNVTIAPKFKVAEVHNRGLGKVFPHQPPRDAPCPLPVPVDEHPADCRLCTGTGVVRQLCECGMEDGANDAVQAMWHAKRHDMPGIVYTSRFTWEDATRVDEGKLVEKDNWKSYPQRMLSWRALGYLIDDAFSEIGTGLYSPDEMGAVTDEDGEPVLDVRSTDNLVRPKTPPAPPIQPDVLTDFKRRTGRLKEQAPDAAAWLREQFGEKQLPKLDDLLHSQQPMVEALIVAAEKQAKDAAKSDPAPEPPASTDTAVEAPENVAIAAEQVPPPETGTGQSVASLPFDPDGLPDGRTIEDDVVWADAAPDEWVAETIDEVRPVPLDEVKSRVKAFGHAARGGEDTLRAVLCAAVIRRRMEKAMQP